MYRFSDFVAEVMVHSVYAVRVGSTSLKEGANFPLESALPIKSRHVIYWSNCIML
jgi:hypothetical protein